MSLPYPERAVFEMIEAAANNNRPCPSNAEIAQITGHDSTASAAHLVAKLEGLGLIEVERFQRSRIVTVVATGRKTAGRKCRPHTKRGGGAGEEAQYIYQRQRRLPDMIDAAERKLIGLHREARRYGMEGLLSERSVKVDGA